MAIKKVQKVNWRQIWMALPILIRYTKLTHLEFVIYVDRLIPIELHSYFLNRCMWQHEGAFTWDDLPMSGSVCELLRISSALCIETLLSHFSICCSIYRQKPYKIPIYWDIHRCSFWYWTKLNCIYCTFDSPLNGEWLHYFKCTCFHAKMLT